MPLTSILRRLRRDSGSPERSSGPPDWVLPGATIDMWFARGVYFGASPDNLSVARDQAGYAEDANGNWVHFAKNAARITTKGLLVEDGCTNLVAWCRDLTNAVWTGTGITAIKNQTGFDGTPNAATSITATAANAMVRQAISDPASVSRQQSAFLKRLSGSGPIEMTMDGGATWTRLTVASTWRRLTIPTQTLANPTVGLRVVTRGDAVAVDCVQNEKLTSGASGLNANSSPIVTTSAGVDRAADVISLSPMPSMSRTAVSMYCEGVFVGQSGELTAFPYLFNAVGADPNADVLGFGTRNDNGAWPGLGVLISRGGSSPDLPPGSPSVGGPFAVAGAFSTARSQVAVNGVLGTPSGANPPLNPLAAVGFGLSGHFQPPPFFYFRRVALWPSTTLSDTRLAAITAGAR